MDDDNEFEMDDFNEFSGGFFANQDLRNRCNRHIGILCYFFFFTLI